LGAGKSSEGAMDAANLLKPMLARGVRTNKHELINKHE